MEKKRPSLKDIAKRLDVSVTTVSFILNGKGKEKKNKESHQAARFADKIET